MRRIKLILIASVVAAAGLTTPGLSIPARAESANMPSLTISQIKLTSSNGQFITLYNASPNTLDLSRFQLEYFNNYDLSKATSNRTISLTGSLPSHSYYILSDAAITVCYRSIINSVSLGFSTSAGIVVVVGLEQASAGGPILASTQDSFSWSRTGAPNVQTLPTSTTAFMRRLPRDSSNNPLVTMPAAGNWQQVQPDPNDPCKLVSPMNQPTPLSNTAKLLPATEPSAIIMGQAPNISSSPTIPAADRGLRAPTITELLPNPIGVGNDSTNEYIELYNPNPSNFDLSGFILEVGTKTLHNYTFPKGETILPNSFKAIYSAQTHLSLSNTNGQARLLDPLGRLTTTSTPYEKAKDGISWALAHGKWYWTTKPSPNQPNVISSPSSSPRKSKKKSTKRLHYSSVLKHKSPISSSDQQSTGAFNEVVRAAPIHGWILAVVAGAALLYGLYEYRSDMANRIFIIRRYFAHRKRSRESAQRR